jgi:hypothetical protein
VLFIFLLPVHNDSFGFRSLVFYFQRMVAPSIELYSTFLSTSSSNPHQSPLREEYLSLGIEAVLVTDGTSEKPNRATLHSEKVLYNTTYDDLFQTATQSSSTSSFLVAKTTRPTTKRQNDRRVSHMPPSSSFLPVSVSFSSLNRQDSQSQKEVDGKGKKRITLLEQLEMFIKECRVSVTEKIFQKNKIEKSVPFLPGDARSWKAQCVDIKETIATTVDNCTISMLEFCDKSYSNIRQENGEEEEEDKEDKLTKLMLILCIPCAYLTAPKYGPHPRKGQTSPTTTTTTAAAKAEQGASLAAKPEHIMTPTAAKETSSNSEERPHRIRKTESSAIKKKGRGTSKVGRNNYNKSNSTSLLPTSKSELFDKCADSYAAPETVAITLLDQPDSVTFFSNNGRFPLHAACLRTVALQSRLSTPEINNNTNGYHGTCSNDEKDLCDTADLLAILNLLIEAYPEAATLADLSGDFPAHHLARQLWRLERQWIARVPIYDKSSSDSGDRTPKRPFATMLPLFLNMTKCTEAVLKPIGSEATLCREKGSSGTLLPLHIGCLNGVSFDTLSALLQGYPEAAKIPCSKALSCINDALPLELFESRRLSTWVLKQTKKWDNAQVREEFDRCSDLIFSYNPSILPYRMESERLGRIKRSIIMEAQSSEPFTEVTQKLWLWLCTYRNEDDEQDNYSDWVKEILSCLESNAKKKLLTVKCKKTGKQIIDAAALACSVHLGEAVQIEVADKDYSNNISCAYVKRYSTIGSLCRGVFGVQETSIPTNFIIFPYKLKFNPDNSVTLASKEDLQTAVDFARFLSRMYTPDELFDTIATKSKVSQHAKKEGWKYVDYSVRARSNALVKIYSNHKGFLYLLDEVDGNPVLPADNLIYPIELNMHSTDAYRLFPLMQMGIQLMRGKSGLSILGEVLLKGSFPDVSDSWYDASASLLAMLRESEYQNIDIQENLQCSIDLRQLRVTNYTGSGEKNFWIEEISFLRNLLQTYDPYHTYSGLRQVFDDKNSVPFWTAIRNFPSMRDALDTGEEHGGMHVQQFCNEEYISERLPSMSTTEIDKSFPTQCTVLETVKGKTEEESALTNHSDELPRSKAVDQESFQEDSLSYEMSDIGNVKAEEGGALTNHSDELPRYKIAEQEAFHEDSLSYEMSGIRNVKAEEGSALTNHSHELPRYKTAEQEAFHEDILSYEMSDIGNVEDLRPLNLELLKSDAVSLGGSKPDNSIRPSSEAMVMDISNAKSAYIYAPELPMVDDNELLSDTCSVSEMASVASSIISTRRITALVAAMDKRRSNIFPSIEGVYQESKTQIQSTDTKVDVSLQLVDQADKNIEELRSAISAVSEEEMKLLEVIDELKTALLPDEISKAGISSPTNKTGKIIIEELHAAANAAVEEEIKLRENINNLKMAVYNESIKCGGAKNYPITFSEQNWRDDDDTNIIEPKSISYASNKEERYPWQESATVVGLKTALDAIKEEEQALQQEIATLIELKSALESTEEEEKALWREHDNLLIALEFDEWKIF